MPIPKKGEEDRIMRNKNLWMVMLLVFTIITSGFQAPVHAADQTKQATIMVIGADPEKPLVPETTISYSNDITATELLKQAVSENQVEYNQWGMISKIKGLEEKDTFYWNFFVNGISSGVGSDSFQVQDGDKIIFRYTDWTKQAEQIVSLKVVDGDNNKLADASNVEFLGTPNAFQLLTAIVGPDQVTYEQYSFGKMIQSIKGVATDSFNNYWGLYINGEAAMVGAEDYPLKTGDQITFEFTSINTVPGTPGDEETTPTPAPSNPGGTFPQETLQTAIDKVSQYTVKSEVDDWGVVALKQAGKTIPAGYLDSVKAIIKEKQGKFSRVTDYERYILGIVAAGANPTNIEGYNLVEAVYNGNVTKQGLNGVAFALIALDSADFQIPDKAVWTREKLINYILQQQNETGYWEGFGSNIDLTSMALTALAPYKNQPNVKEPVEKAVKYLKEQYQNSQIDNSNTAAQAIIALSALGLDANGSEFVNANRSLIQYLVFFQNSDGGFGWKSGDQSDPKSTGDGLQALAAYQLFSQGKGSLYKLTLSPQNPVINPPTETPKTDQTTGQTTTTKSTKTTGHTLPNTASDFGNLMAVGLLLILFGSGYYLKQRKSKA